LLIVFMMVYHRIDAVMIERLITNGEKETGIYAQAYRIVDALFMFASLFSSLLFPIFATMLKKKESVFALVDSAARVLISGALLFAAIAFFQGEFILKNLYQNDVMSSSISFQYLMLSFIPMCVIIIVGTLLTANGNLKFLNITSFIGICINVAINFILIPKYGASGAAITMLITQSIVALVQVIYIIHKFDLSVKVKSILRYAGLITLLIISGMQAKIFEFPILHLLLICLLTLVYCLLTNMFQWRLLLSLIKRKP